MTDTLQLNTLSPSEFAALSPAVVHGFDAPTIRAIDPSRLSAMTAEQFAALENPAWLPDAVVRTLTPSQLRLATDWESVSAHWLNQLSPEAFAAIPAAGINQMSLIALQGLDAAHRAVALKSADPIHAGYLDSAPADATVTYDTVLATLQQMKQQVGAQGLSTQQVDSFNALLARAKTADGGMTYVSSLMNSMVKGGLAPSMSQAAFSTSIDTWFLGVNPDASQDNRNVADLELTEGTLDQAASTTGQGGLGDCGIIAPVLALAQTMPERLSGLIGVNGNGTYAVKLYDKDGQPFFVTVDSSIVKRGANIANGSWLRLVEDAIATASRAGLLPGVWSGLVGVGCAATLHALTGQPASTPASAQSGYDAIKAALQSGTGLVTYTSFKSGSGMISGHGFAVIGIDPDNGKLIFRNPWNMTHTPFELSMDELNALPGSGWFSMTQVPPEYGSNALAKGSALTADWINAHSPTVLATLTPDALRQLPVAGVQALSAASLAALSPTQRAALAPLPAPIPAPIPDSIPTSIPAPVTPPVTPSSNHPIQDLNVNTSSLTPDAIKAMTPQQIAALKDPQNLSATAVAALTATQAAALTIKMGAFSAEWINALSPQALAAIPPKVIEPLSAAAMAKLTPATVAALTPAQLKVMDHRYRMTDAAVAALSPQQVAVFSSASWKYMSLNSLKPESLAAVPAAVIAGLNATAVSALTASTVRALTTEQRGKIPHLDQLSADATKAVHPQDVAPPAPPTPSPTPTPTPTFDPTSVRTSALTPDAIKTMTPQQIATLSDLGTLSSSAVAALSAAQTAALTSMSGCAAAWINALTPQALAAIAPKLVKKWDNVIDMNLLPSTVAALTPDQFSAKMAAASAYLFAARPEILAVLTPGQIATVDAANLNILGLNGLSSAAVAAITTSTLAGLRPEQVAALAPSTIRALTPDQATVLPCLDKLSVAAIGALGAAQVAAIPAARWVGLNGAWINALSTSAFAAVPAADINQLGAETLRALDPAHRAIALKSADAAHAAALNDNTPATDWTKVTAAWLNARKPEDLAAVAPADIARINTSAVSGLSASTIRALTPAQFAALPSPHLLSTEAIGALSLAQVQAIPYNPDWSQLTPTPWAKIDAKWLNALSADAIPGVPIFGFNGPVVSQLSASFVSHLTPSQLGSMEMFMASLSREAMAVITPTQLAGMTGYWKQSDAWMNQLSLETFASIPAATINKMDHWALGGLDPAHQQIARTKVDAAHAAFLVDYSVMPTDWTKVSAGWFSQQSPATIAKIPADALRGLQPQAVQQLTTSTIAAMTSQQRAAIDTFLLDSQRAAAANAPAASIQVQAPALADTHTAASLTQAMAGFAVPQAATTGHGPDTRPASIAPSLVTPH